MLQSWRIKIKEVEAAMQAQRLDEAQALLQEGDLISFAPAKRLLSKLGKLFIKRGSEQTRLGNTAAGWHDLRAARQAGALPKQLQPLQEALAQRSLTEANAALAALNIDAAAEAVRLLDRRGVDSEPFRQLKQVVGLLESARGQIECGRFGAAAGAVETAARLRSDLASLTRWRWQIQKDLQAWQALRGQLFVAWEKADWAGVLIPADQMLAMAPREAHTLQMRNHAWDRLKSHSPTATYPVHGFPQIAAAESHQQPNSKPNMRSAHQPPNQRGLFNDRGPNGHLLNGNGGLPRSPRIQPDLGQIRLASVGARRSLSAAASPAAPEKPPAGKRFVIWVDGVGGFLVCEGNEVTLGQPVAGVDIPILADLSRQHAVIRRSGEGYLLDPRREARVNGRQVSAVTMLGSGSELRLGAGVTLRFSRPNSLSHSARLDFVSRHRTQPAVDGVLLMADCLILGAGPNCHVHCPRWPRQVMLFYQQGQLCCRSEGPLEIDGKLLAPGKNGGCQTVIHRGARIETDAFALVLEELADLPAGS